MSDSRNIVRKFIAAGEEHGFVGGEAFSDHLNVRATYSKDSIAIDPFRTPGVITAGFGLAAAAANGLTQHLTAIKRWLPTNKFAFGMDRKGNIAVMDLVNNNASYIRALTASAITNEDLGLEIHGDALYAAYNVNASIAYLSKLSGISNLPTATWNISFNVSMIASALNSNLNAGTDAQVKHPLKSWQGRMYALNGNRIDSTDGSTGVLTAGLLLPADMVLKTVVPFKNQLVVAASSNLIDNTYYGKPRVFFWDGISSQWDSDVDFPDTDITNLEVSDGVLFAFGPRGVYEFDGSGFNKLDSIDNTVPHGGTDVVDGRLWFKGANVIRGYGRISPQLPAKAWIRPTTGSGGSLPGIVRWVTRSKVIVTANEDSAIYRHESTTGETSAKYITRWIDCDGAQFYVRAVTVGYVPLASGDGCTVNVIDDQSNEVVIGTITFANDGAATQSPTSKDFLEKDFTTGVNPTRLCKVAIPLNAGSMDIRFVELVLEIVPTI